MYNIKTIKKIIKKYKSSMVPAKHNIKYKSIEFHDVGFLNNIMQKDVFTELLTPLHLVIRSYFKMLGLSVFDADKIYYDRIERYDNSKFVYNASGKTPFMFKYKDNNFYVNIA